MTENKKTEKENQREKLSNLLRDFRDNRGLNVKQCILMGEKRINYVKGKELFQFFKENFNFINSSIQDILSISLGKIPNESSIQTFFEIFFEHKLLLKLTKMEGDKAKYPKRLFPPKKGEINKFEEMQFYWINNDTNSTSKKSIFFLFLSIIVVVLGCMFPVWPLKAKLCFLYAIIGVLVFLLFVTVLSLVISFVGFIFGYDVVLFPNFIDFKMNWYDRLFNPLIAYFPREDSGWIKFARFNMALSIVIITGVFIYNPSFLIVCFNLTASIAKSGYIFVTEKVSTYHNKGQKDAIMERHQQIIDEI